MARQQQQQQQGGEPAGYNKWTGQNQKRQPDYEHNNGYDDGGYEGGYSGMRDAGMAGPRHKKTGAPMGQPPPPGGFKMMQPRPPPPQPPMMPMAGAAYGIYGGPVFGAVPLGGQMGFVSLPMGAPIRGRGRGPPGRGRGRMSW